MPARTLTCHQAIFTSIRTPMGEGYRIIAATRGLRADEKQSITRRSPSHDALCPLKPDGSTDSAAPRATAFYSLPSGRLCVAFSRFAGDEQSGRGGLRVYTHNLIFDEAEFATCGYNPFAILRTAFEAGLSNPELSPPAVLPELHLEISDAASSVPSTHLADVLPPAWRRHVLEALLDEKSLVVDAECDFARIAESLILGIPGPLRKTISFGTGMRFSVARCHRLSLVHDDPQKTKKRLAGRPVEYVNPDTDPPGPQTASAWVSFVERHWDTGDTVGLARRTSRPFADTRATARERFGKAYQAIDAIPQAPTHTLLTNLAENLREPEDAAEAGICAELVTAAQATLLDRIGAMDWNDTKACWDAICRMWRGSNEAHACAVPLLARSLESAARTSPLCAAEAALELTRNVPSKAEQGGWPAVLTSVVTRLADWVDGLPEAELEGLAPIYRRWRAVRPQCPALDRIERRCSALVPGGP